MISFIKLLVASCILVLAGCASILNDETQKVNIVSSNGQDFSGTVDGKTFTGPGIVELKRENADKTIVVETAGCTRQTVANKEVSPSFWINILAGGALGSTTDYSTEKMWEYDDTIEVNCSK